MKTKIMAWCTMFVFAVCVFALAGPLPDTGQTKCYNDTEEIPCPGPGESFYGQDGNYNINPPSYTKLDARGNDLPDSATEWVMVRDNVTGLIWEVKQNNDGVQDYSNPHDADNKYTWYDSNPETNGGDAGTAGDGTDTEDFINVLNNKKFGGYSDWRMPTIKELNSIINLDKYDLAIDTEYFQNTQSANYWSSATDPYSGYAWNILIRDGSSGKVPKSNAYYAIAVRSEQVGSFNNFINNGDGTVTDASTGLMWQQTTVEEQIIWIDALDYCETLILSGYNDWRVPNRKELRSVVDYSRYNPTIDAAFFPNTSVSSVSRYGSSTTASHIRGTAWGISFRDGLNATVNKTYNRDIRAVRGGQNQIPGNLIISVPRQASTWNVESTMPITWDTAAIRGNVKISVSYSGGRTGTYETIAESTENNGYYEWMIPDISSFNCVLKIEPLSDPSKGTTQGLFTIGSYIRTSPPDLVLTEPASPDKPGESESFFIMLNEPPDGKVTLDLYSSNPGEFAISPAQVILDITNWETGAEVVVTPEWDGIPDGDRQSFVLASAVGSDGVFNAAELAVLHVTVRDSDTGISVSSVYPTYGTVKQDMPVTIKGTGFADDIQVFIYPEGGTETEITPVKVADGNTITLTIPGQSAAGAYSLRVGDYEFADALTFADAEIIKKQNRKKAIIVAGSGPYYNNPLWDATKNVTKAAYFALYSQGYGSENIFYLSKELYADVTGNGENDIDADATLANLEYAVKTWTKDPDSPASELLLYMAGQSGNGTFEFGSPKDPEILEAKVLDGWLESLRDTMPGRIIFVYDACMSGSFLSPLAGKERIVITSAGADERAWFLDDGEISFSYFFWNSVFYGAEIYQAFRDAGDMMGVVQIPQMDTDGDGIGDVKKSREDENIIIGRGRTEETSPPVIGNVCPPADLEEKKKDSDLWANEITAENSISRVWSRIIPPSDDLIPADVPVIALPTVKLLDTDDDGTYEKNYEKFVKKGDYQIFMNVIDRKGFQSLPKVTAVNQSVGITLEKGDINEDYIIDLTDAIIALKAAAGMYILYEMNPETEVSGDLKIGLEEAVYVLQKVSEIRE